jgi:hypothetical protein
MGNLQEGRQAGKAAASRSRFCMVLSEAFIINEESSLITPIHYIFRRKVFV